jgi:hypothetical protein
MQQFQSKNNRFQEQRQFFLAKNCRKIAENCEHREHWPLLATLLMTLTARELRFPR